MSSSPPPPQPPRSNAGAPRGGRCAQTRRRRSTHCHQSSIVASSRCAHRPSERERREPPSPRATPAARPRSRCVDRIAKKQGARRASGEVQSLVDRSIVTTPSLWKKADSSELRVTHCQTRPIDRHNATSQHALGALVLSFEPPTHDTTAPHLERAADLGHAPSAHSTVAHRFGEARPRGERLTTR